MKCKNKMDVKASRFTYLFWNKKTTVLLWILVGIISTCHSHAFDMQDYCDKEISMTSESIYQLELELDDKSIYDRRWFFSNRRRGECETTIRAWYSTYSKLMLYFEDLDLDCDDGHLEFYVGRKGDTRVTGLEDKICEDNKPRGVFTVNDIYLRIKYIPKKSQNIKDVFSMIITAFIDDTCESYSHKCDNSRCIDKDIACNEYDSCGDGSGCDEQTISLIVGAIVGSVVVIGIIGSLIVCYICCKRKARKVPATSQANSSMGYNATGHLVFNQPTYGANYEGSYPSHQSPNSDMHASVPSRQTAAGLEFEYAANDMYDQTQDLPPPYSEVAQTDQERYTSQGKDSPDYQSNMEQEPVYAEPNDVPDFIKKSSGDNSARYT